MNTPPKGMNDGHMLLLMSMIMHSIRALSWAAKISVISDLAAFKGYQPVCLGEDSSDSRIRTRICSHGSAAIHRL